MDATDTHNLLKRLHACSETRHFAQGLTLQEAWDTCPRGDWLLWLAAKLNTPRPTLVYAACQCARIALPYADHSLKVAATAIETTERWCKGEATLEDVRRAAAAAYAAAAYAADYADAYADAYDAYAAAYAATYAAYAAYAAAAYAAAYGAAYAAYADDAAYAATYAAYAAAYSNIDMQLQTAYVVRQNIPYALVLELATKYMEPAK